MLVRVERGGIRTDTFVCVCMDVCADMLICINASTMNSEFVCNPTFKMCPPCAKEKTHPQTLEQIHYHRFTNIPHF